MEQSTRFPFSDVYNKIPYLTIEQAIQRAKHDCFQTLGVFEREDYTTRGVQWHHFLLDEWHETHVVVPSDKDGSYVPMTVDAYLSEQEAHLRDKSPKGDKIYHKLGDTSKTSIDFWLKEGRQWQGSLFDIFMQTCPTVLSKPIQAFVDSASCPTLPKFRLLVKSHKRMSIVDGRWPSRPITALVNWATTQISILAAVVGNMCLRIDRASNTHPFLSSPLIDTTDTERPQHMSGVWSAMSNEPLCATLWDFSAYYTNVLWEDVAHATKHWAAVIHSSPATDTCLSPLEKEFALWLFTPLTRGQFDAWSSYFPWLEVPYTSELYLVSFFLAIILSHNVFLAPWGHRGGVFRQLVGFSMGTNAAPAWGNLIARAYERATPLPPTVVVYRFLDDGCICYPLSLWGWVHAWLKRTYPPHLPWDLMCTNSTGRFSFLDVYVISLSPLHHHTYFKETHSCAYVPWNSNVPRSTKTGWITGECIRHLRRCSHRPYYQAVLRRLQLSLVRLRYPKHLWERFPITWDQRHRYVGKRPKQQGSVTHVLRAPYSSVINASGTSVIGRLEHSPKFRPLIPSTHRCSSTRSITMRCQTYASDWASTLCQLS